MDFQAAFFDFDGTLVDSMDEWKKIMLNWTKKNNIDLSESTINDALFLRFDDIMTNIHQKYPHINTKKAFTQWVIKALYAYIFKIKLIKGAKLYLEKLKTNNIKIVLVTNCPKCICIMALKKFKIFKYFDEFIFTQQCTVGKDQPDAFLEASSKINILPENIMVYEDSPLALIGAKKAGMKVTIIGNPDSFKSNSSFTPDKFIQDYCELI